MTANLLILIVLSAGCNPAGTEPEVSEAPAEIAGSPEAAPPASFDPWSGDATLLPAPEGLRRALIERGLGPAAAANVAPLQYRTGVSVARINAPRTGAEIGALALEAGWASPEVVQGRLERIQAGIAALEASEDPEAPGAVEVAAAIALWAEVSAAHAGDAEALGPAWAAALDGRLEAISALLEGAEDPDRVPLVLAGCWLQIVDALLAAMIATEQPELAGSLLDRPDLSDYFEGWIEARGGEALPGPLLDPMKRSLALMRDYRGRDDLTIADLEQARELSQDMLGML